MSYLMSMTFERVTEQSASNGDFSETGFEYEDREFDSLDEMAVEIVSRGPVEFCSWFSTLDADINLSTGEKTYYSFHPVDLSEAELTELKSKLDRL